MSQVNCLDVYLDEHLIGSLANTTPLTFAYDSQWLCRSDAWPILGIALRDGANDSEQTQAFFENLLPEGELRRHRAAQSQSSGLFSLLLAVAGDTAGGFTILPSGHRPAAAQYELSSWASIAAQLKGKGGAAANIKSIDSRISLAGAQDKTSLAIFADGLPRLPKGTAPSTHILKPNIRGFAKIWHSAANETIVMRTAQLCGLPVADVFYEPLTQSCVIKRFDRILTGKTALQRLVQYDFCQLASALSTRKYENEGGPNLSLCADFIRQYSDQSAIDLRHLIRWTLFNLFVGNNDSHAKNLSIYQLPEQGVRLTPFYDLLCTRIYPGLAQSFAFSIGGEFKPGLVKKEHIERMAQQLKVQPKFVFREAQELALRLPNAIEQATESVSPQLDHSAKIMAGRLERFVRSLTKSTIQRIAA